MEYADEPRLIFHPLKEQDYCTFYNLEMDRYIDDAPFYTEILHIEDQVLELGCGTGRLTRLLAGSCKHITGVDRSVEMLRHAHHNTPQNAAYKLMDMLELSFSESFDVIIIPYNTINLLGDRAGVEKCLQLCSYYLHQGGNLAFQAYHPDSETKKTNETEKQFQFVILEDQKGGRVIKETLKWFQEPSCTMNFEERYRVRPAAGTENNRDLRHNLRFFTPHVSVWEKLLHQCGFSIKKTHGTSTGKPFNAANDTSLFIHAVKN
jgi:ubiquinone/menaquinone biosynthesis C-methylase UbiE